MFLSSAMADDCNNVTDDQSEYEFSENMPDYFDGILAIGYSKKEITKFAEENGIRVSKHPVISKLCVKDGDWYVSLYYGFSNGFKMSRYIDQCWDCDIVNVKQGSVVKDSLGLDKNASNDLKSAMRKKEIIDKASILYSYQDPFVNKWYNSLVEYEFRDSKLYSLLVSTPRLQ